jgi:hypothetical protein
MTMWDFLDNNVEALLRLMNLLVGFSFLSLLVVLNHRGRP